MTGSPTANLLGGAAVWYPRGPGRREPADSPRHPDLGDDAEP